MKILNKATLFRRIQIEMLTIGIERREAGWKYFFKMSAQYTKIRMKILNKANEPAVKTNSDKNAPIHAGCSLSQANIATGV